MTQIEVESISALLAILGGIAGGVYFSAESKKVRRVAAIVTIVSITSAMIAISTFFF